MTHGKFIFQNHIVQFMGYERASIVQLMAHGKFITQKGVVQSMGHGG